MNEEYFCLYCGAYLLPEHLMGCKCYSCIVKETSNPMKLYEPLVPLILTALAAVSNLILGGLTAEPLTIITSALLGCSLGWLWAMTSEALEQRKKDNATRRS